MKLNRLQNLARSKNYGPLTAMQWLCKVCHQGSSDSSVTSGRVFLYHPIWFFDQHCPCFVSVIDSTDGTDVNALAPH